MVGTEGLLDPIRRIFLITFAVQERRGEIGPGVSAVQHQMDVRPDSLAHGANPVFLFGRRQSTNFHLDCAKALLDIRDKFVGEMLRSFPFEVVAAARICRYAVASPTPKITE